MVGWLRAREERKREESTGEGGKDKIAPSKEKAARFS